MLFVGLDWSLNSPALTVIKNDSPSFYFFHKTYKKKTVDTSAYSYYKPSIRPSFDGEDLDRIYYNAAWALEILKQYSDPMCIAIEGSAMHGSGRVATLAENNGAVKFALMFAGYTNLHTVPPTTIKKFATGKGNADKPMMYDAAKKLFEVNKLELPSNILGVKSSESPVSDIIDSYFLALYAKEVIHKDNNNNRINS